MTSRIAQTMGRGAMVQASKKVVSSSRLATLAPSSMRSLYSSAMARQEGTTTGQETSGGHQQSGGGQQQQSQGGSGGQSSSMQSRRGGMRRRGAMRPRGNDFDVFRQQINRLMNDFDESMFGGRMSPFGGGANLFNMLPMSPFGMGNRGRFDMPLLGGGVGDMLDTGRGSQALLDVGDEEEGIDENALALPATTSALDLVRGAPAVPVMRLDVEELDDKYAVTAEVPGFKKEDLHVRIEDGMLTIDAKHRESKKHEDPSRKFLRTERIVQSARRQLRLSSDVDQTPGKVKAKYQDGILKIELPKLAESKRAGKVEIEAASTEAEQSGSSGGQQQPESSKKSSAAVMPE